MHAEEEKRKLYTKGLNGNSNGTTSKPQMYTQLPHINDLTEMIRPPRASYRNCQSDHRNSSNNMMIGVPDEKDSRRQSTTTLQRLILVAHALEYELDSRRQNDVNGGRVIFSIRMVNLIMLIIISILILTGVGQYSSKFSGVISIHLTVDKWFYSPEIVLDSQLPESFTDMRLSGQCFAIALTGLQVLVMTILQILQLFRVQYSRLVVICIAFGAVPLSLIVFGLEMHFSACPWLDQFYRKEVLLDDFDLDAPFDSKCTINGWALAGIFSLLSCGLFVAEGLVASFFRIEPAVIIVKSESLL